MSQTKRNKLTKEGISTVPWWVPLLSVPLGSMLLTFLTIWAGFFPNNRMTKAFLFVVFMIIIIMLWRKGKNG